VADQSSKQVKDFLSKLASSPQMLVDFIKDPDGVLKANKIRNPATREHIRKLLAVEVARQILVSPAAFVHWGT
jgi:hypothetical protein